MARHRRNPPAFVSIPVAIVAGVVGLVAITAWQRSREANAIRLDMQQHPQNYMGPQQAKSI